MKSNLELHKGEIYMVDFGNGEEIKGSEQGGVRPAVIVQNDKGNHFSPTTIVVPITSKVDSKHSLPTHIILDKKYFDSLTTGRKSMALGEVIRTIDKQRVVSKKLSKLTPMDMRRLNKALMVSLELF